MTEALKIPFFHIYLPGLCGSGLTFCLDGFRLIYLAAGIIMWSISGIFSLEYMAHYEKKRRYYVFFWATFFATMGVFLSGDFYTTFLFFEIMSFTSYVWVAFDEKTESLRAAQTYLAVAVIGGLTMLMGLFLLNHLCGTLEFQALGQKSREILETGGAQAKELYMAGILMLTGFGAKAGCFPLHIWLPKAHPAAPAPASALLSGILTKTGIFGLIVMSFGIFFGEFNWGLLIVVLGLITMFLGAFLAVFSINLKRTLACSSISQIGFILTGLGIGSLLLAAGEEPVLAVRGTLLHMINHSLFKLVLFLCAGTVFMNLHQLDLNHIRGFGRNKPALGFCFFAGAAGLAGIPGFSGYVSKTLLHESIVEYGVYTGSPWCRLAEWVFLLSGGMTAAYMTKLFVALFLERNPGKQEEFDRMKGSCIRPLGQSVLVGAALLIPLFGLFPGFTMDGLADLGQDFFVPGIKAHPITYFSPENLKGAFISIAIGGSLYGLIRRFLMADGRYIDGLPKWLDLEDLIYRPVVEKALLGVCGTVCKYLDRYVVSIPVTLFLQVSALVCRSMDHMADGVILLARNTTHSQIPSGSPKKEKFGKILGTEPGGKEGVTFRLFRIKTRIIHLCGLVEESFSFGLMLFSIGLFLTIGYLLLVFFGVL